MSERLPSPQEVMGSSDLQRFYCACAHERRSPMTTRMIDAASYGWVHRFIQTRDEVNEQGLPYRDWAAIGTADPRKIEGFFERVAVRMRGTPGHDYALQLEAHYKAIADSFQTWPAR